MFGSVCRDDKISVFCGTKFIAKRFIFALIIKFYLACLKSSFLNVKFQIRADKFINFIVFCI